MKHLSIDIETYSSENLAKCGVYRYCQSPDFEILLFGYSVDGADVIIVGHTHKPFITQPSKIYIDKHNNCVSVKPFKVVSTTSWLQYGGYAAQKMLTPSSHAVQTITLCGNKKEIIATM